MAENRLIFFTYISLLFLVILSSCTAYGLFKDSAADPVRPIKYHTLIDPSRYADRTKEYHDTLAKLRLWRRYLDIFDQDNNASQG
ncbi:unnamed protein product [Rotaria sp. Silwood1]|nr:unnamed protein product [Rotaria sp. Silwood1]CAF0972166.1 unnamed protein product [Rotaria sp. Silwood1]CAF0981383.1 unnamed protein product [Rotaria sp. Silwood1]CAF3393542.1 unnamed protein product [Rotaria sp. Silwood1]CAF3410152.1 unnamed protein product [Rotaria sp. Silwood1]